MATIAVVAVILVITSSKGLAHAPAPNPLHTQAKDPYFPSFHIRPAAGHVNDPNGPFYHAPHKLFHLFMQYHSYEKTAGSIGWYHFTSPDLVTWTPRGQSIPPDGKGCPNTGGVFSGSTALLGNIPRIVYPGVHTVPKSASHPDGIGMAQCLAQPANMSDPFLTDWVSRVIIPTDPVPTDVNNHFHDDAQVWQSAADKKFYTFVSGGSFKRTRGVNLLYSTTDINSTATWQLEHALWNITDGSCNFVSCPELYPLPGHPDDQPRASGTMVYEALCGGDKYWIGHYDDDAHSFQPMADQPDISTRLYDFGKGRASKSFWHEQSQRRIMWSWITWSGPKPKSYTFAWDGAQTVPRHIQLDPTANRLTITPAAEVAQLRTSNTPLVTKQVEIQQGQSTVVSSDVGPQVDILVNFSWPAAQGGRATVRFLGAEGGSSFASVTAGVLNASYLPGYNIPRGDIVADDFLLPRNETWGDRNGSAVCLAYCNAHPECSGYTFVRAGFQHGPRCAIKNVSNSELPEPSPCCVSGYAWSKPSPLPPATVSTSCTGAAVCSLETMPAHTSAANTTKTVTLRILVDRSIVEVYDAKSCLSTFVFVPVEALSSKLALIIDSDAGTVQTSVTVYTMGSAFPPL
eukprot:m.117784 g.117784  ORF g.117784 m.117784 type:complete len:629 (-) comp16412_c1_seq4:188-2074(-)